MKPTKLAAGWYSAPDGNVVHYWQPWEENDYFMLQFCRQLTRFCSSLTDDPRRRRCINCEKRAPQ